MINLPPFAQAILITYILVFAIYSIVVFSSVKKFLIKHGIETHSWGGKSFPDVYEGYRLVKKTGEQPYFIKGFPVLLLGLLLLISALIVCENI